jgi:hypothetical protein
MAAVQHTAVALGFIVWAAHQLSCNKAPAFLQDRSPETTPEEVAIIKDIQPEGTTATYLLYRRRQ